MCMYEEFLTGASCGTEVCKEHGTAFNMHVNIDFYFKLFLLSSLPSFWIFPSQFSFSYSTFPHQVNRKVFCSLSKILFAIYMFCVIKSENSIGCYCFRTSSGWFRLLFGSSAVQNSLVLYVSCPFILLNVTSVIPGPQLQS